MTYIIGIDPGPRESGYCEYNPSTRGVFEAHIYSNDELWDSLADRTFLGTTILAIEFPCFYGKSVSIGKDVLETAAQVGWFEAAWWANKGRDAVIRRITRREVRMHLCGTMRSGDPQVWTAILDQYGGRAAALGTRKIPGPLYGVKSHARAALAVAITAAETTT